MPHIHTKPGEIDYAADVFVVHMPTKRVLLRFHDKHKMWLVPGGHIELNELPHEAAVREVEEEVGLKVELYTGHQSFQHKTERYEELFTPNFMNIHNVGPDHRHLSLVYFATSESDEIREPENHEKSGGCIWLTKEELLAHPEVDETIKYYGLAALETLAP